MPIARVHQRRMQYTLIFLTVIGIFALSLFGIEALSTQIPVPQFLSQLWYMVNFTLVLTSFWLLYQNLNSFVDKWNFQELAVSRGMVFVLYGAAIGYLSRAFTDQANVSLGTPIVTVGCLFIIYGAWANPLRFDSEQKN